MDFKIIAPENELIKKYTIISYEGFLNNVSYYAYPHYGIPITFLKDVEISISSQAILIKPSPKKSIRCIYANTFYRPIKIETQGKIEEFCVVFKPYGLSQFINSPLLVKPTNAFFEFSLFNNFIDNTPDLFMHSLKTKNQLLECYLLNCFNEKKYTNYIIASFNDMLSGVYNPSIYPVSNKTFYRAFKNICGVSSSIVFKIIQFRKSLERMKEQNSNKTICQLAHELGYYDQAHFNHTFRKLTDETPCNFFKAVSSVSEKNFYFKFE